MKRQFAYLTDAEYQRLQNLAAYCGCLQKRRRLDFPDPRAFVRALANLPPEQWERLREMVGEPCR